MKEIFTRHMAGAMRVSGYYSQRYPMMSDDFHDAVTDALIKLDRMDIEPDYPTTFVQQCVRNACLDVCRKIGTPRLSVRLAVTLEFDPADCRDPEAEIESQEFALNLRAKLMTHLPEQEYRAICLVDLGDEGDWGKKRARELGMTYKNVHYQRTKGVQRAREVLAGAV